MAELIGLINIIIIKLILTFQRAAQGGVTCYYILVKFDSPDGSSCCSHKYFNNLVNFNLAEGSTSWGYICCYYISV